MSIEQYQVLYLAGAVIFLGFYLWSSYAEYPKRKHGDYAFSCFMSVIGVFATAFWPISLLVIITLLLILSFSHKTREKVEVDEPESSN